MLSLRDAASRVARFETFFEACFSSSAAATADSLLKLFRLETLGQNSAHFWERLLGCLENLKISGARKFRCGSSFFEGLLNLSSSLPEQHVTFPARWRPARVAKML